MSRKRDTANICQNLELSNVVENTLILDFDWVSLEIRRVFFTETDYYLSKFQCTRMTLSFVTIHFKEGNYL